VFNHDLTQTTIGFANGIVLTGPDGQDVLLNSSTTGSPTGRSTPTTAARWWTISTMSSAIQTSGTRTSTRTAFRRVRLERGPQPERLLRHQGLSGGQSRCRERGVKRAAALSRVRLERRPRSVAELRHRQISCGVS
jgi:hypothetical protein